MTLADSFQRRRVNVDRRRWM